MRKSSRGGGHVRELDARLLVSVRRDDPRALVVDTHVTRTATVKPHHFVAALLDLSDLEARLLRVLKIGTTFAEAVPAASTARHSAMV